VFSGFSGGFFIVLAVLLPHLGRDALEIEPTVLPAKDLLGVRGQVYDFWCGRDRALVAACVAVLVAAQWLIETLWRLV
jgi:hypothetical protein